jgi:predicted nucleic acid-binding protein
MNLSSKFYHLFNTLAVKMAIRYNIYAYDAYYLQCCIEHRLPLISLDKRMCEVANNLGIKVVE